MSATTPYDAIFNRLVAQFGATWPVIAWETIETALQQGTTPFIAVDDGGGSSLLESIGSPAANWILDTGAVVVHIFVPSTGSLSVARSIADQVRAAMRYFYFPVPAGETMRCTNVDPPSDGVIHDGLWHSMMMPIDFEYRYVSPTAST